MIFTTPTASLHKKHHRGCAVENDNFISPLVAPGDEKLTSDADLQHVLNTLRSHLNMDVAFISEFRGGERRIRAVDSNDESPDLQPGDTHLLKESYCHFIAEGELPQIIDEARENPKTKDMAVTEELDISSYIGVPIELPDGSTFGTFCCFDHQPGTTLNERDLSILQAFADFTGRIIGDRESQKQDYLAARKQVLKVINERLTKMVFQPIYHMREQRVVGFEALCRFQAEPQQTPDVWFKSARDVGLGMELELMVMQQALQAIDQMPDSLYLSLNVSPEYLLSGACLELLEKYAPQRVVLEITEHARITDYERLREVLKPLREKGFQVAVDDAGAGYANFKHILELNADAIKLDVTLIRNIHSDIPRRALAASLIRFAEITETRVIAEGVETKKELDELNKLGVDKVQGYYIGKPCDLEEALSRLDSPWPEQ